MKPFLAAPLVALVLGACTFEGGGIVPMRSAPSREIDEDALEVPYVPTPHSAVATMLDMAELASGDYLIDLGSGDGRIPIMAAQRGARALGVDIDPDRVTEAEMAAGMAGLDGRVRFLRQDLFDTPLREASVVTLYLLPRINLRLRPRLLTELRPGARVVSHNFGLGDWLPDERREVGASTLFLWVVPVPVAGQWRLEMGGAALPLELEQRFQQVSGHLGGRPLRDVQLRGRRIAFTADTPQGERRFAGTVGDTEILADPPAGGAVAIWRAVRAE